MTLPAPSEYARRLRTPGYLILTIAMVLPLADLITSVMPMRITTVVWRFGAVGLFASAIGAPLLVLFLIYCLAYMVNDRRVMLVCGAVAAFFALLLVLGAGAFMLDALQMKARVQAAAQPRFLTASFQAMIKLILQALASVTFAVSVMRTLQSMKATIVPIPRNTAASGLIMGRQSTAAPRPALPDSTESTAPIDG